VSREEHRNWIGGRWCSPPEALRFEPPPGAEGGHPGRWPRSGPAEVGEALAAWREVGPSWLALDPLERRRRLGRLEPILREDRGLLEELGLALGLEPGEPCDALDRGWDGLASALDPWGAGLEAPASPGVAVIAAHWTDLLAGLTGLCLRALADGWGVVLLASPELPRAAEAVVEALSGLDLPPGALALLHDDGQTALRAAAEAPEVLRIEAADGDRRARQALRAPGAAAVRSEVRWREARCRSHPVRKGSDPAAEAEAVVRQAFGRSSTLSGQLPGRIGRVLCHELEFSRFCEELLARLEGSSDEAPPVPLLPPVPIVDEGLHRYVRWAWALGLDEGATLIFGGEPYRPAQAMAGASRQALWPTVFSNVEPHQRFARLRRPAPILALLRVRSDREGTRLAAELDGID